MLNHNEIYEHIIKLKYYNFKDAKTPASTISALLGDFIRKNDSRVKRIKGKQSQYFYYLAKFEKDLITGPIAEDLQMINGENPRLDFVVMNPPQFNSKKLETMNAVPLKDDTWCVIWRKSYFGNVNLKEI